MTRAAAHRSGRGGRGGPPRPRARLGMLALAGWLFADLLLVLALVSMSGQPDPLAAEPSASPSAPEETEEPEEPEEPGESPPEPEQPRSVEQEYVEFGVGGGGAGLVEQIAEATEQWEGRQAAFVMTFGGSQDGTRYAGQVNAAIHRANPEMFPRGTTTEDFHDLSEPPRTATVRVYFYTGHSGRTGTR